MSSNPHYSGEGLEKKKGAPPYQENAPSETTPQKNDTAFRAPGTISSALNSRSTGTAAQCARLLELLKASPQTTYSARARGISHAAARIMDLRRDGHVITSTRVNAVDSDGYTHVNVALYSLASPAQSVLDLGGA